MNISRTARTVLSVVAVAVVALLAFGGYALAQSDSDSTAPTSEGAPWERGAPWRRGPWHGGDRGPDPEQVRELRAELAADLAAELDTPADDVEAAFRAVVADRLADAVEAGRIDQAQADDALAAYDDGEVGALFRLLKR